MIISPEAKQKVTNILTPLAFATQRELQELPQNKVGFLTNLKLYLKKNIHYNFDQEYKQKVHSALRQSGQILQTKQLQKFITKNQTSADFAEFLMTIIRQQQEEQVKQSDKMEEPQFKEKMLDSVFAKMFYTFTLSQLNDMVQNKWKKFKNLNFHSLSTSEKKEFQACKEFQQFTKDFDINIMNQLKINHVGLSALNYSGISHVTSTFSSWISQNNESKIQQKDNPNYESVLEYQDESINQIKPDWKQQKQMIQSSMFIKRENEKQEKKISPSQQTQSSIIHLNKKQKQRQEKQGLDFMPLGRINQIQNPQNLLLPIIQTNHQNLLPLNQEQRPNQQQPPNQQPQMNQGLQDQREFQTYSEAIINRYQSQNRFTQGQYRASRQAQVQNIINTQLRPLINFLQSLPHKDVDKNSFSNLPIGPVVQVYGSFKNKCGFRKISDININLTINSINSYTVKSCLFHLRNKLDNYRKKGNLNFLNLKSIIYSQEHSEVIISHQNNTPKPKIRDPSTVNYIYITINRRQHVGATRFMNEVVYNNQQKSRNIAHLFNFLHLLFKRNKILQHKDVYHVWWTPNTDSAQQKKISQSRYVSIPIYALHMMIFFYLQQTGQISKVTFIKQKKKYDFEFIDKEKTLYQMVVEFLRFYSQSGDYVKYHQDKDIIDIVEGKQSQEQKKRLFMQIQAQQLNNQMNRNMFAFVHPLIIEYLDIDNVTNNNYIEFAIEKGSLQQKLFFKKISKALEKATDIQTNAQWDPEVMFEMYEQEN